MMRAFVSTLAVALVASCFPLPAAAAGPAAGAAPVRSMTFDVDVSAKIEARIQTSGLAQNAPGSGQPIGAAGGSSVVRRQTNTTAKGTITVEIVAIVNDGLVVDVAENAQDHTAPKTRIGVTLNGKLLYDPAKAVVNEEEILLLQLLNRALVEGHDADGASWTDDTSVRGFKDVTTYRILSSTQANPGPVLHMEVERSISASTTAHPFDLTETGKLDYNEFRAIPLDATLRTRRTNTNASGQQEQTDTLYTYKLTADTGIKH